MVVIGNWLPFHIKKEHFHFIRHTLTRYHFVHIVNKIEKKGGRRGGLEGHWKSVRTSGKILATPLISRSEERNIYI